MKSAIFLLIVGVIAATNASPLPEEDNHLEEPAFEQDDEEEMMFDIKELGIELFPNGTVKFETVEELREHYQMKNHLEYFKTVAHFEKDEREEGNYDEDEEEDREKRIVFDYDERLPVPYSYSNDLPYCAIAELAIGCTGIFIGPYHVLTAAACVYNVATSSFRPRSDYNVYRTTSCNSRILYEAQGAFIVGGYAVNTPAQRNRYNYALVITDPRVRSPCWMSFGFINTWNNRGLDLIGYPTDRIGVRPATCSYDPFYSSSCHYSFTAGGGDQLVYRCDANNNGAIGAPLISEAPDRPGQDLGQRAVYGLNSNYDIRGQWNFGPRITSFRFNQLIGWMRQTGYDPAAPSPTTAAPPLPQAVPSRPPLPPPVNSAGK